MLFVLNTGIGKLISTFMVIDLNGLFALIFRVTRRCVDIGNLIVQFLLLNLVYIHRTVGLLSYLYLGQGLTDV
jgi:hypothetical protein